VCRDGDDDGDDVGRKKKINRRWVPVPDDNDGDDDDDDDDDDAVGDEDRSMLSTVVP